MQWTGRSKGEELPSNDYSGKSFCCCCYNWLVVSLTISSPKSWATLISVVQQVYCTYLRYNWMHLPVLIKCKVPLMHPMRMSCFLGEYCENFIRVQGGSFGSIQNLEFKRLGLLKFYRIKDTYLIYYSLTNTIIYELFQRYTKCFIIQQIYYYRLENDG